MKQFLLSCDFLGFTPAIHIENKLMTQSIPTAILSILIGIVGALTTGYFGSTLLNDPKPTVVRTITTLDTFAPYEVSNLGFNPMLAMTDDIGHYYTDSNFFTVKAYQDRLITTNVDGKSVNNFTVTELEVDICSKYYKQSDIKEKNIIMPLDSVFCVKPHQEGGVIKGFWGEADGYSVLRMSFQKCVNSTKNNFSCNTPEEMNRKIQGGYVSMDYTNYIIDERNYTTPLQKVIYDDFNMLNAGSTLRYNIFLNPISFVSDNGILMENNVNYAGFYRSSKIIYQNVETEDIVQFTFQGASSQDIYLRSYPKLQTTLTQIGGFIKFIMICGNLISIFYAKNCFLVQILMSTIHANQQGEGKSNILKKPSKLKLKKPARVKLQTERVVDPETAHDELFDLPPSKKKKTSNVSNQNVAKTIKVVRSSGYFKFVTDRLISTLSCTKWEQKS